VYCTDIIIFKSKMRIFDLKIMDKVTSIRIIYAKNIYWIYHRVFFNLKYLHFTFYNKYPIA